MVKTPTTSHSPNGRFTPHKPLPNDGSALFGKCVRCVAFSAGPRRLAGLCRSPQGFKEVTGHHFTRGAAAGPSIEVHKLDGCSYWRPAW